MFLFFYKKIQYTTNTNFDKKDSAEVENRLRRTFCGPLLIHVLARLNKEPYEALYIYLIFMLNLKNIFYISKKVLREYIKNNQMRVFDLFKSLDKDKSMSISIPEFVAGLQQTGVPLRHDELLGLVKSLDLDGDGEIDYR